MLDESSSDDAVNEDLSAAPQGLPRHDVAAGALSRQPVEVLASQFIDEHRQGKSPSIEDYAQRFPQQAGEIRRLFPLVAAMETWKSDKATAARAAPVLADVHVDRLGDCQIIREIGRGGMGVVFEAYQDPPGRRVAVKILPSQHGPDSPWREQFAHEARLAASLRHGNIVPVYQYSEQAGFSYYVMPFIVGVGLDWIIQRLAEEKGVVYAEEIRKARLHGTTSDGERRGTPVGPQTARAGNSTLRSHDVDETSSGAGRQLTRNSWKKIAKIGVQAAAALRHAHLKGLLHRDIKPANLLLDTDGVVWITDFGLARQISSVEDSPVVAGTLRYMSPEHLAGSADERSDVYSLGITLHELCTQKPAFAGRTRSELQQAICQGALILPRAVNPQIPQDLEAIILKAAASDPQRRYQSADELKSDLLRFVNSQPIQTAARSWRRRRRT